MFDFSDVPKSTYEEESTSKNNTEKVKLDLNTLLERIDNADYDYYDTLSEEEKKLFTPYTVLRWVSSLDDSIQVTYSAKNIENVFSKWSSGGKEVLNELKDEFNTNPDVKCMSVSKYEHAKYDWRIKFSVQDMNSANKLIETITGFGVTGHEIVSLVDNTTIKHNLILLNNMVNVDFWSISGHPELVYQLLCSVSSLLGKQTRKHNWLPFCKGLKNVDTEIFNILKRTQSALTAGQMNVDEYKILLLQYSTAAFTEVLEEMGYSESDIKNLIKKFKSEQEKYGK